jgi:excisionase family DNA binding protein
MVLRGDFIRPLRQASFAQGKNVPFHQIAPPGANMVDGAVAMEESMKSQSDDALLTPAEVAAMFRVDPKTVTRWAKAGKLNSIRTLGGHRRYHADEVRRFLEGASRQEQD